MKALHCVSHILVIIGGLNWLLVAIFGKDLGVYVFGGMDAGISRLIYVLVGLAAIFLIFTHKSYCANCRKPEAVNKPAM